MSFPNSSHHALPSDVQEYDRFSVAAVATMVTFLVECGQSIRLEVTDPCSVRAAIFGRSAHILYTIRCSTEQLDDVIRMSKEGAFSGIPLKYELSDGRFLTVSE